MSLCITSSGLTDAALQATANLAAASGQLLTFPFGQTLILTQPLKITSPCAGAGCILQTSHPLSPALELQGISESTCTLPHVIQTSQVWAAGPLPSALATLDSGVRITNCLSCNITLGHILGFSIGTLLYSASGLPSENFCAYNTIHLGHCENNKVNLAIATDNNTTGPTASSTNQHTLIGGRMSHYSSPTNSVAEVGTRHILIALASSLINGIIFLGTSLEGDTPEFHVDNFGLYTQLIGCRWETSTVPPKYRRGSATVTCLDTTSNIATCRNDMIIGGYSSGSIVKTDDFTTGFCQLDPFQLTVGQLTATGTGLNATAGFVSAKTLYTSGVEISAGSGPPNGSVIGSIGDEYTDTSAPAKWFKASGTATNIGWIQKW